MPSILLGLVAFGTLVSLRRTPQIPGALLVIVAVVFRLRSNFTEYADA